MMARLFECFIERLRAIASELPDRRTGANTQYSMADILLAACALFFTQSPSFLAFQEARQQARGRNHLHSLFRAERIPTANHIRHLLDPIRPQELFGCFDDLLQAFEQTGLPQTMRAVENSRLIALDGTW